MGNIKSKSPRNNCEFENFDPPDHIKPVDNFVISKLAHKKTIFLLKNVTVKAFPLFNERLYNWNIYVTKRRIKVGSCGYLVQEVYGLNESEYGIKKDQKDERIKNCAICLETPSNTILLPCSHICLCSECSKTVSIQFGACPMCRTVVSQILHINDHR
eukprot:XP_766631.1 hypothetical protein [Theileria parva strain Muguga]